MAMNENLTNPNDVKKESGLIAMSFQTQKITAVVGCLILFIGVFMPLITLPFIGSINYIANGKGDGIIVMILAVISFVFILLKKYKALYFTGLGSLGMTLITFLKIQSKLSNIQHDLDQQLAGNLFKGLAVATMNAVHMEIGWGFLVLGAILLLIAASAKTGDSI